LVCPAEAKPNQVNAPKRNRLTIADQITITDPHHPLHDQTFPLIHIQNTHRLVLCGVVQLAKDVERLVPLQATNLAERQPETFPLSLGLSSLEQLIRTYEWIQSSNGQEVEHAGEEPPKNNLRDRPVTPASMANADHFATGNRVSNSGTGVSIPGASRGAGGER
jgi:hypothetical protein